VLSAVVLLIAPKIDESLSDAVYSFRLKDPLPRRGPIFREAAATDLPFLKRKTVATRIDPFEGWYKLWPEFDLKTRAVFQEKGFRYLATSDIAAYFENIQIPILRDQLLKHFNTEHELINLLCHFLESWADRTADGRPHHRGIPQGNMISSFLGNLFLMPLDAVVEAMEASDEVAYFRYMDDVRIFTKHRSDARVALLYMARKLRELHLNVQTAKTRIYDEAEGEIQRLLVDSRVDDLNTVIDQVKTNFPSEQPPAKEKRATQARLKVLARRREEGSQPILGARRPLEDLSLRAFSRWVTAHMMIGSDRYLDRLLREIGKSSDNKLTKKLVATAKRFPRKRRIEIGVMGMIGGGDIIFDYQEAECLRALRYLNRLQATTFDHAFARLKDGRNDRYLRMQAGYLLSRSIVSQRRLTAIKYLFERESDPYVQVAAGLILAQDRSANAEVVRGILLHLNEKIREMGKLFRVTKNEPRVSKRMLEHALRPEVPWLTCDYLPMLHLMANSRDTTIRQSLVDALRQPRLKHPIVGVREVLQKIFTEARTTI